jgi:hypothetical protein
MRTYNNPMYKNLEAYIHPEKHANHEELAERIYKPMGAELYNFKNDIRDSELELKRWLEDKTVEESSEVTDDITEEDLDQAIFEASFTKLNTEDEELKSNILLIIDLSKRNNKEIELLFRAVGFNAFEQWADKPAGQQAKPNKYYTDKAQYNDPLYHLYSEVEHPVRLRWYIKRWRSGAEMRFKMPYYPETKDPSKTFTYI